MLTIEYTGQFKKDLKRAKKREKNVGRLKEIMDLVANGDPIPKNLKEHALSGNWSHHRELHIEPDWLLVYRYKNEKSIIIFVRTGSHSDLF